MTCSICGGPGELISRVHRFHLRRIAFLALVGIEQVYSPSVKKVGRGWTSYFPNLMEKVSMAGVGREQTE